MGIFETALIDRRGSSWPWAACLALVLAWPVCAQDEPSSMAADEAAATSAGDGPSAPESTEGSMVEVGLVDGSNFRGRIVSETDDLLVLETAVGRVEIDRAHIDAVTRLVSGKDEGSHWRPSANQTRLFFAPTGRNVGAGNGYVADYYLFFPSVTYGLTDRFTVSGGVSVFPGAGLNQLYYAGAKLGVAEWDKGGAGVGLLAMGSANDAEPFGIVYGVSTFGNDRRSGTVGVGVGYYGSSFAESPLFMLGAQNRVSERIELVTENYVGMELGDAAIVSYGFRFLAASMTVDFGFWTVMESDAGFFPGIPYIDFVFTF